MRRLIFIFLIYKTIARAELQLSELESLVPTRFQPRIVRSTEADPHQFPHQVLLKIDTEVICSGSIIRNNVILTSASCLKEARKVTVIAGVHNQDKEESTQQKIESTKFKLHENFDPKLLKNNIALINLPRALILNDYVKTISIYKETIDLTRKEATVAGWGVYDSSNKYSSVLRYATNRIIADSICKQHHLGLVDSTNVCLSASGVLCTMNGDGGAPLLITENNKLFVAGVVSFETKGGCLMIPSVYSRVSSYAKWIDDNINTF